MNFFQYPQKADSLYARIRDEPKLSETREQIETYWARYCSIAPKVFLKHSQNQFKQRWWEMYLGIGLLNLGLTICTNRNDHGPDFKVMLGNNQTIWIEAMAPHGFLPELKLGIGDLPRDEFLLQITSGLSSKCQQMYKYLEKEIISDTDGCVIAINSADLGEWGDLMNDPPAPLSVLAGAGNVVLTPEGRKVERRTHINKKTGANIDSMYFNRDDFKIISAILYSSSNPLNCKFNPEDTFEIFLNPNANQPLLISMFNHVNQWIRTSFTENGEEVWEKVTRC